MHLDIDVLKMWKWKKMNQVNHVWPSIALGTYSHSFTSKLVFPKDTGWF